MNEVIMVYNEERGTWNVYNGAEWYYESEDYDKAEQVFDSFFWQDEEEYEEEVW